LRQHNFAVFRGSVAGIAALGFERRMREGLHQLRLLRLVRVVALNTVGVLERLSLVRLLQLGALHIVAIQAQ
jgi:hypothetical protein